jgi:predicted transcriptional regulator
MSHAMNEATFTFRVEEQLKSAFAQAAKAKDRTGAQLLRDFMREFVQRQQQAVEHDTWFRQQVQVGLDAANAGDVFTANEVEAEAESWREAVRQRLA